jgi:outer membrane receptor for ferrienterochelin and colicin
VIAEKQNNVKNNVFDVKQLSMKEIRELPLALGQADLIKAVQLQTGVKTVGDGSSGMFIRGGSADQNLLLIDDAPVYNPSHLFGLVSVFNPDAINSIKLYKGNIPAQYGGRASGVLECTMREGNDKKIHTSGSINPFAIGVSTEFPIQKEKTSAILTARRSLFDLFVNAGANLPLEPSFFDFNFKINHRINTKNRLFFSTYVGSDYLKSADGLRNHWGNQTFTFRWNKEFSNRLFMNTIFTKSNYYNRLDFASDLKKFKWNTGVSDIGYKTDFSYYINPENTIRFGLNLIYHKFIPGEQADSLVSVPRINALETALYVQQDIQITPYLGLNYGLRWSVFQNTGKGAWFNYNDQLNLIQKNTNTKGIYNTYQNPEPRLTMTFSPSESWSVKLSATRTIQYMQVLQNNPLSYSSLETWFPASKNVKPLIANTLSIGYFKNISSNWAYSIEFYQKNYQNQIDFIDHARLINNPFLEGETRTGTAKAKGMEVNLEKKSGLFQGSISYSFSSIKRTIVGINDGESYRAPHDIPHDLRLILQYFASKRLSLGAFWTYSTGRPLTLPLGFYYTKANGTIPIYTKRNTAQFPDYHRLDLSLLWHNKSKPNQRYNWTINAGIYNTYSRLNPLGYEFAFIGTSPKPTIYAYTLFKILPNIGFTFKY